MGGGGVVAFWRKLTGSLLPSPDIGGWLDACGLDWRATRGELAQRFGVSADNPYQWDMVELAVEPPPMRGLLRPLSFQVFHIHSPLLPPARLTAHVWRGDDARGNLTWAMEQLAPALGQTKFTSQSANTLDAEWRSRRASLRLSVFPPDMQGFPTTNPAHERDPRLATACIVEVLTGWRPPLSEEEGQWLANSRPLANSCLPQPRAGFRYFAEPMLEYMRDASIPSGAIHIAGAGEALLVQAEDLFVLPRSIITGFSISRLLPAKGAGGSSLSALCKRIDGGKDRSVLLAQRGGADDLNELGGQLAGLFSKPLVLEPYQHDC